MTNKYFWLKEKFGNELFSPPVGIHFLTKIFPEFAGLDVRDISSRISIYFWWEIIAKKYHNKNFKWELSSEENQYLSSISTEAWVTNFSKVLLRCLYASDLTDIKPPLSQLLTQHVAIRVEDQIVQVPLFISLIMQERSDLKAAFDISSLGGLLGVLSWWDESGATAYPSLNKFLHKIDFNLSETVLSQLLTQHVAIRVEDQIVQVPLFISLIMQERSDLKAAFDISSLGGLLGVLSWWDESGATAYPSLNKFLHKIDFNLSETVLSQLLTQHVAIRVEDQIVQVPLFISLIMQERSDLKAAFDISSLGGLLGVLSWWDESGATAYPSLNKFLHKIDFNLSETVLSQLLTQHVAIRVEDQIVQVPLFISLIMQERSDLKAAFDISSLGGLLGVLSWWDESGATAYPSLNKFLHKIDFNLSETVLSQLLTQHVAIRVEDQIVQVPLFISLIMQERSDLKAAFDISSLGGLLGVLSWWDESGATAYPSLNKFLHKIDFNLSETVLSQLLTQHVAIRVEDQIVQVPLFISLIMQERSDLKAAFDISSLGGLLGVLSWWDESGATAYPSLNKFLHKIDFNLSETVLSQLLTQHVAIRVEDQIVQVPLFISLIMQERSDLKAAFDISSLGGLLGVLSWWDESGATEYNLLSNIEFENPSENIEKFKSIKANLKRPSEFGVNIIGFAQSALGIGEDARMAALALNAINIRSMFLKAPLNGPEISGDLAKNFHFNKTPKYSISMFCLPPTEMVRLGIEAGESLIEMQTYKIGAWPWELPYWPKFLEPAKYFVDEIWAQSRFVYECFSKLSDTKVYEVPMVVSIPAPNKISREYYKLKKDSFVFYSLFDGNSWLSRKNPLAGIYAFQKAFRDPLKNVQFVVKAMNISPLDPTWEKIVELSSRDPRIQIISTQMSRQDLINFMHVCDSFVSLHRSEGFGRVLAEAMLLEQPVIATNFSGNTDFCHSDTALLVDGELVPLKANDYLLTEGQYWCEPSIEIAALHMSRLYDDRNFGKTLARNGRLFIEGHYDVNIVAEKYKNRIYSIDNQFNCDLRIRAKE